MAETPAGAEDRQLSRAPGQADLAKHSEERLGATASLELPSAGKTLRGGGAGRHPSGRALGSSAHSWHSDQGHQVLRVAATTAVPTACPTPLFTRCCRGVGKGQGTLAVWRKSGDGK